MKRPLRIAAALLGAAGALASLPGPGGPPALQGDCLLRATPAGRVLALLGAGCAIARAGPETAGWIPVRIEGFVPAAALAEGGEDGIAAALFAVAGRSLASEERRIWLDGLEILEVVPIRAGRRGKGARLQFQVVVRNRTGLMLAAPWVELALLDRHGQVFLRTESVLKRPPRLEAGQEGAFDCTLDLTEDQVRRYHKRRIRARGFLPPGGL